MAGSRRCATSSCNFGIPGQMGLGKGSSRTPPVVSPRCLPYRVRIPVRSNALSDRITSVVLRIRRDTHSRSHRDFQDFRGFQDFRECRSSRYFPGCQGFCQRPFCRGARQHMLRARYECGCRALGPQVDRRGRECTFRAQNPQHVRCVYRCSPS